MYKGSCYFSEDKIIRLGKIPKGSKFKKKIKIYNRGFKDLKIYKIENSCSCTSSLLESDIIKRNEFTELSFEILFPFSVGSSENTICIRNNSLDDFYLIKIYAEIF